VSTLYWELGVTRYLSYSPFYVMMIVFITVRFRNLTIIMNMGVSF